MKLEQIGHLSFILGVIIAIVAGLAGAAYVEAAAATTANVRYASFIFHHLL